MVYSSGRRLSARPAQSELESPSSSVGRSEGSSSEPGTTQASFQVLAESYERQKDSGDEDEWSDDYEDDDENDYEDEDEYYEYDDEDDRYDLDEEDDDEDEGFEEPGEEEDDDEDEGFEESEDEGVFPDPQPSDISSRYTKSITSSVVNYPVEYGRRYHAFRQGVYRFPNDEEEMDRLDMCHAMMIRAIGNRHWLAPLQESQVNLILDIGTGTGIWALEMGDIFGQAEIIGIDLSAIQPEWVPGNVKFEIDDIESSWIPTRKYDYIMCRYMAASIQDWPGLMRNVYDHLNYGGWAEFQDMNTEYYSDDGSYQPHHATWTWNKTWVQTLSDLGRDPSPGPKLEGWVRDAGFVNMGHRTFKIPIGPWAKNPYFKDIGLLNLVQILDGLEAFSLQVFCGTLKRTEQEVQAELAQVRNELRSGAFHSMLDILWTKVLENGHEENASTKDEVRRIDAIAAAEGTTLDSFARLDEKKVLRKMDIRLIPMLALLYLLSFLDRGNIGNAKIEGLQEDLNMTADQYNWCLTVFFFTYAAFEVPSNLLLKKLRPSVWLPTIMVAWGIVMTLMGIVRDYHGLLIARIFLGVTEAGLFPGVAYYLTMWYCRHEIQLRQAMFFSAASIAGAFSGLLAFAISKMDGTGGLEGWRWIFILEGIATVVVAVWAFFALHDFPETAKFLTEEERAFVVFRLKYQGQVQGKQENRVQVAEAEEFKWKYVWDAFMDWQIWVNIFVYWGIVCPLYGISLFLPTIIRNLNYTSSTAQLMTVPIYITAAVLAVIVAYLSDKLGKRSPFIVGFLCMMIVGFSMCISSSNPKVVYGGVFVAACAIYPAFPGVISWLSNNLAGSYKRSAGMALQIGVGNLGGVRIYGL
ncbi:putative transporter C1002.16c-like protein 17 [Colletotrichum chlorophyti]|uniref:Putative transporter C1002.16c-like protein 17 n=1 Tax=Colletotrichum chlorophyti TaxID=708187 RepID=A0A1Q8RAE5_9PEZI|nr:putative transporter C1002.16c-like protein 17 [Colletotrichum chlorophyti]